jgi:DNA invertase Pin-like site-specific DNA recombinase
MRRYKYIRSSTFTQNNEYQKDEDYIMYIDHCSGTIPFEERDAGKMLLKEIEPGSYLQVETLDRLGRNSLNTLQTLNALEKKQVQVEIKDLATKSLLDNGKPNPGFQLICSVLSIVHEQARNNILEAQAKGIAIAKARGNVFVGRKRGSTIPRGKYLKQNTQSVRIIKAHPDLSLRQLGKLCGISHLKVKKIKEML